MIGRLATFSRALADLSTGDARHEALIKQARSLGNLPIWGAVQWRAAWELVNLELVPELNLHAPPFCSFREVDGRWGFYVDEPQLQWACDRKEGVMRVYAGDVSQWEAPLSIDYFAAYGDEGTMSLFDAHTKEQIW